MANQEQPATCPCCGEQIAGLTAGKDCPLCEKGRHSPACKKKTASQPAQSEPKSEPAGPPEVVTRVVAPAPPEPPAAAETQALTVRKDFGGEHAVMRQAETASVAVAAQAKAAVESRYIMAMQRPRDLDAFRQGLINDAKRRTFAEQAVYRKPVGGDKYVEGPSIRFVEAALRHFRNVLPEKAAIFDSPETRIVRVTVTDLESNVTYSEDVTIEKTVERSNAAEGSYISKRKNSRGKDVYLVPATSDDLLNKENALVSKAIRNLGLRILPADIVEEAIELGRATIKAKIAADPDAERKKIADAFAEINVPVADLKLYLGHDLAQCSPAELVQLRAVHRSIRDGETTWASVKEAARPTSIEPPKRKSETGKA